MNDLERGEVHYDPHRASSAGRITASVLTMIFPALAGIAGAATILMHVTWPWSLTSLAALAVGALACNFTVPAGLRILSSGLYDFLRERRMPEDAARTAERIYFREVGVMDEPVTCRCTDYAVTVADGGLLEYTITWEPKGGLTYE